MGFKAINDKEKSQPAEAGETQEAREARIIKTYESALHLIARGSIPQAMVRLPQTLSDRGLFRTWNLPAVPELSFVSGYLFQA